MPHSFGYRARTRDLFAKKPGKKGTIALGTYLRVYKRGDYVDVIGDGAVHKGMPHKFYHGKTGVVWNVSKRAIGVIINKQVGGRIIPKKIHVRVEHVRPSTSREQFKARVKANAEKYAKWKAEGRSWFPGFQIS
jgi:large subunit ribosomal protein L21e